MDVIWEKGEATVAEVAAALEDEFMRRGVNLLKGARATDIERTGDTVTVTCEDGRVVHGSHAVLAVGSIPNSEDLGVDEAGVERPPSEFQVGYTALPVLC